MGEHSASASKKQPIALSNKRSYVSSDDDFSSSDDDSSMEISDKKAPLAGRSLKRREEHLEDSLKKLKPRRSIPSRHPPKRAKLVFHGRGSSAGLFPRPRSPPPSLSLFGQTREQVQRNKKINEVLYEEDISQPSSPPRERSPLRMGYLIGEKREPRPYQKKVLEDRLATEEADFQRYLNELIDRNLVVALRTPSLDSMFPSRH